MRLIGPILVALVVESSLIAVESWAHQKPATAAEITAAAHWARSPRGGYIGIQHYQGAITSIFDGTPAQKAGLMVGDKILDINDRTTYGLNEMGLSDRLIGEPGTEVDIVVGRGTERRKLCLVRALPTAEEMRLVAQENEAFAYAKPEGQ